MFRFRFNDRRSVTVELAGQTATLVSVGDHGWIVTRWFGFGGAYVRPAWVELMDQEPSRIPIQDHWMLVRLGVALALIGAFSRRWLR